MNKARYHEMFRSDIIQFVRRSSCKTLMIWLCEPEREEIDVEMEKRTMVMMMVMGSEPM